MPEKPRVLWLYKISLDPLHFELKLTEHVILIIFSILYDLQRVRSTRGESVPSG